jgi:hypothetical protein
MTISMQKARNSPQVSGLLEVKKIEHDHFLILCRKIKDFEEELGVLGGFVAGLIAAYDYSRISMI